MSLCGTHPVRRGLFPGPEAETEGVRGLSDVCASGGSGWSRAGRLIRLECASIALHARYPRPRRPDAHYIERDIAAAGGTRPQSAAIICGYHLAARALCELHLMPPLSPDGTS